MGVQVGHVIASKYRLLAQIGEGGMGSVWSGVHELLDRPVAIKFLHAPKNGGALKDRFLREARSAAKVKSRYVADVFDYGVTEDGVPYMVQELLEGEDLGALMYHGPAWQVRDVVRFMCQCLTALEAVHEKGVVHCDVKPENVFVVRDSEGPFPKLLDFGICSTRLAEASEKPASHGRGKKKQKLKARESTELRARAITEGTPAYMAPEQLRGLPLDGRADLYSVGVILYEWLSGRLPYEQSTPEELCAHIAARSALPLSALRPELGHALSAIVMRALSPEPAARFASAAAMRTALSELVPELPNVESVVKENLVGAPIGTKTERILTAASNPFREEPSKQDDEPKLIVPTFWQSHGLKLAGGLAAVAALALFGLPRVLPSTELVHAPRVRASVEHADATQGHTPRAETPATPGDAPLAQPGAELPVLSASAQETARAVRPAVRVAMARPSPQPSRAGKAVLAASQPAQAAIDAREAAPTFDGERAAPSVSEPPVSNTATRSLTPIENVQLEVVARKEEVKFVEPALEERPLRYDARMLGL